VFKTAVDFAKRWGDFVEIRHTFFSCSFALAAMMVAARADRGWPGWLAFAVVLMGVFFGRICFIAWRHAVEQKDLNAGLLKFSIAVGSAGLILCGALLLAVKGQGLCLYTAPLAILLIWLGTRSRRYTDFYSFYYGGVYALAPVGAWMAVTGSLSWQPFLLGAINALWVSGLETLSDVSVCRVSRSETACGHSLVACWGEKNAVSYAFLVHLIMLMGMAVFGFLAFFKLAYMIGVVFIALVVLMEHWIARIRKKHWLGNAFFRLNMVVSLVYLAAVGCEVVLSFFDNFYRQ